MKAQTTIAILAALTITLTPTAYAQATLATVPSADARATIRVLTPRFGTLNCGANSGLGNHLLLDVAGLRGLLRGGVTTKQLQQYVLAAARVCRDQGSTRRTWITDRGTGLLIAYVNRDGEHYLEGAAARQQFLQPEVR